MTPSTKYIYLLKNLHFLSLRQEIHAAWIVSPDCAQLCETGQSAKPAGLDTWKELSVKISQ